MVFSRYFEFFREISGDENPLVVASNRLPLVGGSGVSIGGWTGSPDYGGLRLRVCAAGLRTRRAKPRARVEKARCRAVGLETHRAKG